MHNLQFSFFPLLDDLPAEYKEIKRNDKIRVEAGTLYIDNVQKSDEGYYSCEANNGDGSNLRSVIFISIQEPPTFAEKLRNQTARRDEPAVLECDAKGEQPIHFLWKIEGKVLDPKSDKRYSTIEEISSTSAKSLLMIRRIERTDHALFTCSVMNAIGVNETSINLIVQELPESPYMLKVLNVSSHTVHLSWAQPWDGNSPILDYMIEYKASYESWNNITVPGNTTEAELQLKPATTYSVRVSAINEHGTSTPSDDISIITPQDVPIDNKPKNIKIEPTSQTSLRVTWNAPPRSEENDKILGYYIGIKISDSDYSYYFETVDSELGRDEYSLEFENLKPFTLYSVIVQSFDKDGVGPASDEEKRYTSEKAIQSPTNVDCIALSSENIQVSWVPPSLESTNSIIKGYKIAYAPSELWNDNKLKTYKKTESSETVLRGLKKFTNHTIQVQAMTSGGDGIPSDPIYCKTKEDGRL